MKLIITMSGHSKRFTDIGLPHKLFVDVSGKPAIERFLSVYDNIDDKDKFVIKQRDMSLGPYCDNMNVVNIDPNTDGPVFSILDADLDIDNEEEVIVTYSDFFMNFNAHIFLYQCMLCNADGAIVTHSGFHPHRLYNSSFCYLKTKGSKVLEVKEKSHFTNDPMNEPASSGIYYFRSFGKMKKYFTELIDLNIRVNNEFYVTMPYNLMIRDELNVIHVPVENYMCLGAPADVHLVNYSQKHWRFDD
jgi:molybdopterin-guanine dinucleotide biosynthesis protein A